MEKAKAAVRSIEVVRAIRSTKIGEFNIKKKQAMGFLDDELVAVGNNATEVLNEVLAKQDLEEAEVITLYYGADTELAEAEQVSATICQQHPQLQVEVVKGGQPHYNFIVSVE